jgi:histidinol-phosphatase (PHP family)
MMKLTYPGPSFLVSYHNHSNWSDGAASLETVCREAKKMGLKEFGLSDHYVVPPKENMDSEEWSMRLDRLDEYIAALQTMKKELDDDSFTLRIGLEVDFFFENMDEIFTRLKQYPLDYLIGSVHCCGTFPVDHDASDWLPLPPEKRDAICEMYWQKLEGAAKCKEFTFLGHLDLPKKFAIIDNDRYLAHASRVLDILKENGGAIELNTSGWFKPCAAPYPSLDILKAACAREIPVYINADAHHCDHVRRNFTEAIELLQNAGYKNRA